MTKIIVPSKNTIKQAAALLEAGGLVGMPTETVYGLAANALNSKAVARIFGAKGRPAFNPLICHFHSLNQIPDYADVTEQARLIAHHFWPGPLTLILPKKPGCGISDLVTAGLDTLAVRVPSHKVAQDLLRAVNVPLAAPSANISGSLSPTTPAHVVESLGHKVDMVLAAGACTVGLESTVLDLSGGTPVILRPGAITAEDIEYIFGFEITYAHSEKGTAPKSPGMLLKHYAPDTPVRLNAIDLEPGEALLAFGSDKFMGIKGGGAAKDLPESMRRNLSESGDLHEAAANLFSMLKNLDRPEHKTIAVMSIPEKGLGIAINDRLHRAAEKD